MFVILKDLLFVCGVLHVCKAGIIIGGQQPGGLAGGDDAYNEDEWESVYRIYHGDDWDSHDDYLSQERTARYGDEDDSQFRSWKLDQWHHSKIQKVRIELYDDGDEVAEFEFEGVMQNMTSFFNPRNLRKTTYIDIPVDGTPFPGDDFSFDGDDDARHWTVSSRHRGNCRNDEGWIQVIDKPKPGRERCVCGYENVNKFPTIMYSKGNRKTKWSDARNVGYADMMQVSVSHVPYPVAVQPVPVQIPQMTQRAQGLQIAQTAQGPQIAQTAQGPQITQVVQPQQTQFQIQRVYNPFETK